MTITTSYIGPVGFRGSRITASTRVEGKKRTKTVPYNHGARDAHAEAAQAPAEVLGVKFPAGLSGFPSDAAPRGFAFTLYPAA